MKLLGVPFFILFSLQISAQRKTVLLTAQVKNDSIPAANVHVVNLNSNKGSLSDDNGIFRIQVKVNDTLQLSNIKFITGKFVIENEILQNKDLNIFQLETNELEEVVILHKKEKVNAFTLGLPNAGRKPLDKFERKLEYYDLKKTFKVMPGGLSINLENIYYILSGENKKDKKFKKLLENDKKEKFNQEFIIRIREHFGDEFFINTIKIPKDKIENFIDYCLSKNIIFLFERARYLDMIDVFLDESKVFK